MSKITLVEYSEKNNLKFDSVLEFINTNLAEGKSLLDFEELYSIEYNSISPYFKKKNTNKSIINIKILEKKSLIQKLLLQMQSF